MIRLNHATLPASLVALALAAAVGCAQPPAEGKATTTSKLLAPKALLVVQASKATRSAVGVSTWKVFRSKKSWILTGYAANGAAVHGIELVFAAGTKSAPASLHGRWLDGSKLTMQHDYGGSWHSSAKIGGTSKKLVEYARFDLRAAQGKFAAHTGTYPHVPSGGGTAPPPTTTPAPTGGTDPCGGDLTTILTSALACLTAAGSDAALKAQCIAAAQSAASAQQTCAGGGTATPPDGTGGMCGGDPTGGAGYPGDPTGGAGYPGDPGAGGDPGGGGYPGDPGDPGAGGYPGDPGAGGYPGDPGAGAGADPTGGAGGACGCDDPTNPMCQDPCAASADPTCDPNGDVYGDPTGGVGDQAGAGAAGSAGGDTCYSCDPSVGDDIDANDGTGDVGYGGD